MSKVRVVKKAIKFGIGTVVSPRRTAKRMQKKFIARATNRRRAADYNRWYEAQRPTADQLAAQTEAAKDFKLKPLISIIVPLYNTPEQYLRDCLDSVRAQTYDNWQLCLADDASPEPAVIKVLKEYAAKDSRIEWTRMKKNGHIAVASNEGLKLAKGEFVALLDHDDLLEPYALYEMVKAINASPKVDLLYSDEDKIEEGHGHLEPFFKPDWSPEFLHSCNYITHFAVLRRSLIEKIGGFRDGTEGAQDWDLFLRFVQQTDRIVHVPKVLYNWRKSPTSTAKASSSKPYAYINQRRALRDSLKASDGTTSVFESIWRGFWRVRYQIEGNPKVSIIIPTKDSYAYIKRCLESVLEESSYPNFEVIVVDTGSTDEKVLDLYKSKLITSSDVKIIYWNKKLDKKFNFSGACNSGAEQATGDYLLFLNNDTEAINSDWIESMMEHAQRPEIGMVGAKLYFPSDNIQHAGVVLSKRDIAFHPFYNQDPKLDIFTNIYLSNTRDCSAVTAACSMVSAAKFKQVGGFDETLRVTYNDVDLCLRLLDAGYRNVYTPHAELYHYESVSVGKITGGDRDKSELEAASKLMRLRWAKYLDRDPYYNDNFAQHGPGYDFDLQ